MLPGTAKAAWEEVVVVVVVPFGVIVVLVVCLVLQAIIKNDAAIKADIVFFILNGLR